MEMETYAKGLENDGKKKGFKKEDEKVTVFKPITVKKKSSACSIVEGLSSIKQQMVQRNVSISSHPGGVFKVNSNDR
jgi:hypothetical protein